MAAKGAVWACAEAGFPGAAVAEEPSCDRRRVEAVVVGLDGAGACPIVGSPAV